jgi:hypothetical protein
MGCLWQLRLIYPAGLAGRGSGVRSGVRLNGAWWGIVAADLMASLLGAAFSVLCMKRPGLLSGLSSFQPLPNFHLIAPEQATTDLILPEGQAMAHPFQSRFTLVGNH